MSAIPHHTLSPNTIGCLITTYVRVTHRNGKKHEPAPGWMGTFSNGLNLRYIRIESSIFDMLLLNFGLFG